MMKSSVIKELLMDAVQREMESQVALYDGKDCVRLDLEPASVYRASDNVVRVRVLDLDNNLKTFSVSVREVRA